MLAHWIGVQGPSKLVKKNKTPHSASLSQANPSPKSNNFFNIEPRRLSASVEGLNHSLAIAAGEL